MNHKTLSLPWINQACDHSERKTIAGRYLNAEKMHGMGLTRQNLRGGCWEMCYEESISQRFPQVRNGGVKSALPMFVPETPPALFRDNPVILVRLRMFGLPSQSR